MLLSTSFILSCKTTKVVVAPKKIRHLSVGRVTRLVREKALRFETLSAKKVSVELNNNGKTSSIRGSLKIRRDSIIQITAQKLSIPVGKLELNPDSFRIVYYLDKENIFGSVDYISNLLGIDIDFNAIQSILTDQIFSIRQDSRENKFRDFACEIENDLYKITTIRDRKMRKLTRNEDRFERYLNRKEDAALIKQDIYVDPDSFVVRKLVLDDLENKRRIQFEFSKFEKVSNQWFPSMIDMDFRSDKNIHLSMDLSRISLNDEQNFGFTVAPKYKKRVLESE
jgi:hypothetical protein